MKTLNSQRGVAIIMVLLIVALATVLAAFLAQQQQLWQRQVESQYDRAQARRLGIAGIDWARAVLADDAGANLTDHEGEVWALRMPAMPVDKGEVQGVIEDRQGLFNLNSLVSNGQSSEEDVARFQRLLVLLDLPIDLAASLADWMDSDSQAHFPGGAEDSYYLSLAEPRRAANRPLVELGELSAVKGFNEHSIERLRPFVSVLPITGAVNVNFAPAEVLTAVIPDMKLSDARQLVLARHGNPFKDIDDFTRRMPASYGQMDKKLLSVKSDFFWVTGRSKVANSSLATQALLKRAAGWPTVVWQRIE